MSASDIIRWQKISPFAKQTIERMIRPVLPKRLRISDEFKNAINRCAQVYVLSVAATAQNHYNSTHLTEQMVIQIIGLMGFPEFVQPLQQFHQEIIGKKSKPRKQRKSKKIDLKVEIIGKNIDSSELKSSDLKSDTNTEDIEVANEINTQLSDRKE